MQSFFIKSNDDQWSNSHPVLTQGIGVKDSIGRLPMKLIVGKIGASLGVVNSGTTLQSSPNLTL